MVDLGAFFGAAFADPLALPERCVELIGIRNPTLTLTASQVVDVVASLNVPRQRICQSGS